MRFLCPGFKAKICMTTAIFRCIWKSMTNNNELRPIILSNVTVIAKGAHCFLVSALLIYKLGLIEWPDS